MSALNDETVGLGCGTSGEGCDVDDLELPGAQRPLVEGVVATGTPTIVILLTGRAYAVGWMLGGAAAVAQAFFPGEEGAGAVAGSIRCAVTVRNTGRRGGAEVVQRYASGPVASVTRPPARLVAFERVHLEPGESVRVGFAVPTRLPAFTGRDGRRIIEPGTITVGVRRDAGEVTAEETVRLTGAVHHVDGTEPRISTVTVSAPSAAGTPRSLEEPA
ncbi:fibronectin type III-like domain-contianing protein [Streptomyces sp. NPDC127033]|uniref:fibronectin type III-like domain-contianing protein n=1 Tax=Streptomyces sp. NPDC127033 TaxID=3347110 RepID=UPI0036532BEB